MNSIHIDRVRFFFLVFFFLILKTCLLLVDESGEKNWKFKWDKQIGNSVDRFVANIFGLKDFGVKFFWTRNERKWKNAEEFRFQCGFSLSLFFSSLCPLNFKLTSSHSSCFFFFSSICCIVWVVGFFSRFGCALNCQHILSKMRCSARFTVSISLYMEWASKHKRWKLIRVFSEMDHVRFLGNFHLLLLA